MGIRPTSRTGTGLHHDMSNLFKDKTTFNDDISSTRHRSRACTRLFKILRVQPAYRHGDMLGHGHADFSKLPLHRPAHGRETSSVTGMTRFRTECVQSRPELMEHQPWPPCHMFYDAPLISTCAGPLRRAKLQNSSLSARPQLKRPVQRYLHQQDQLQAAVTFSERRHRSGRTPHRKLGHGQITDMDNLFDGKTPSTTTSPWSTASARPCRDVHSATQPAPRLVKHGHGLNMQGMLNQAWRSTGPPARSDGRSTVSGVRHARLFDRPARDYDHSHTAPHPPRPADQALSADTTPHPMLAPAAEMPTTECASSRLRMTPLLVPQPHCHRSQLRRPPARARPSPPRPTSRPRCGWPTRSAPTRRPDLDWDVPITHAVQPRPLNSLSS